VHPDQEGLDSHQNHRDDDPLPADESSATEGLERLEHNSQRREEDDVHLRMTEEPEDVRPQQARALVSGEVLCEEQAVDRLQQERCCSAENANSIIQMVSSHDQENIGMFQRPSPSARDRCIVTRKFTDPSVIETTNRVSARIVALLPEVAPIAGVYVGTFSGAYIVQPPANVPPWKNEIPMRMPENR